MGIFLLRKVFGGFFSFFIVFFPYFSFINAIFLFDFSNILTSNKFQNPYSCHLLPTSVCRGNHDRLERSRAYCTAVSRYVVSLPLDYNSEPQLVLELESLYYYCIKLKKIRIKQQMPSWNEIELLHRILLRDSGDKMVQVDQVKIADSYILC